jgi:hypothetical protein
MTMFGAENSRLRIGLGGGVGLPERIQLHRVGCQSGNDGVTIQRYFEAAGVPDLWNEA